MFSPSSSPTQPLVLMEELISWILYEDDEVIVLDKPGWLVCHPSKNGPMSSLVGAVKEYLGASVVHLVSRLDRETSGVVLLAKNRRAASHWQKGVEKRSVSRTYLAIMAGRLLEGRSAETNLGRDPESPVFVKQRVVGKTNASQRAITRFHPLHVGRDHTFCLVETKTGRKHQIRVHAQWLGHPLVGDKLYGPDEGIYLDFCHSGWKDEWFDVLGMNRQALHCHLMRDQTTECGFHAPLPLDMRTHLLSRVAMSEQELARCLEKARLD